MIKSLELNWIRKRVDKSIIMPEVIYLTDNNSGAYYPPNDSCEILDDDNKYHDCKNGIIALNPIFPSSFEGTIAHEWKHHWQRYNGVKYEIPISNFNTKSYNEALFTYFKSSKSENDALRFEYKHAGLNDLWVEILNIFIKDLIPKKLISYGKNTHSVFQ